MSARWFAVYTHHGGEYRSELSLMAQGFDVCLPLCAEQGHGEFVTVIQPLFPRYLFVRFDPHADQWRKIYRTRGVAGLVQASSDHPTPLPGGVVESLQARMSARRIVDDPHVQTIRPGDHVRVVSGMWNGFDGVCTMQRRHRVTLLLCLFERSCTIDVPREMVRVA